MALDSQNCALVVFRACQYQVYLHSRAYGIFALGFKPKVVCLYVRGR